MKKNFHKAFSLIELSIVILIIGILVAGVTQSSRLINQLRLITARNITTSSPVYTIKDLVFWIEPTLEQSFDPNQASQDSQVTLWNDINPATSTKFFFVKTASPQVVYESNGINGLPAIKFLGDTSQDYVSNRQGAFFLSLSPSQSDIITLPTAIARMTIFFVAKLNQTGRGNPYYGFYNGRANGNPQNGWGYQCLSNMLKSLYFPGIGLWNSQVSSVNLNPQILTVQYGGIGVGSLQVFVNGLGESFPANNWSSSTPTNHFIIGNGNGSEMWNGLISEVIVYDRILNAEERLAITQYLSKKYAIKI